jgi:hypothetical protein
MTTIFSMLKNNEGYRYADDSIVSRKSKPLEKYSQAA